METLEPILKTHPFFADLAQKHFDIILGCASNVRFKDGDLIFKEGAPAARRGRGGSGGAQGKSRALKARTVALTGGAPLKLQPNTKKKGLIG